MVLHVCPKECGQQFEKKQNLNKHLAQKIPCDSERRIFGCTNSFCKQKFTSRQSRHIHLKTCKPKETKETLKEENINMSEMLTTLRQQIDNFFTTNGDATQTLTADTLTVVPNSRIASVTKVIDRRSNQFYFCHPPGKWSDIRRVGDKSKTNIKTDDTSFILKIGYNGNETGRHTTHDSEFGDTCRIIDSLVTPASAVAETKIKDMLRNDGKLFSGLHGNKKTRDTELIIVKSQEDYREYVELAQRVIFDIEGSMRNDLETLETWKEKTRQIEALCRQTEAMVAHANHVTTQLEDRVKCMT